MNLLEAFNKCLQENRPIRMHLGSGYKKFEGYINIDLNKECSDADVLHDCTNFPDLADNSIDEIFTCHMIEHIGHRRLVPTLIEWRRILKPKGKIIIETPNLNAVIEKFASIKFNSGEIKGDFGQDSAYETLFGGQDSIGAFHISCLNPYLMMIILKAAGFIDEEIKRQMPQFGIEYGPEWNMRFEITKNDKILVK